MGKARALGDGPASLHVPRVIVKIEADIQIRSPCLDMRCHMAASVNLKQVRCRTDAKLVEICEVQGVEVQWVSVLPQMLP